MQDTKKISDKHLIINYFYLYKIFRYYHHASINLKYINDDLNNQQLHLLKAS